MYDHGVDEQVIKEVTGHRSDAVWAYKRTSDNLLKKALEVIGAQAPTPEFDIDKIPLGPPEPKDVVVPGGPGSKIHKLECTQCITGQCGQMCRFLKNLDAHKDCKVKKVHLSLKYKR